MQWMTEVLTNRDDTPNTTDAYDSSLDQVMSSSGERASLMVEASVSASVERTDLGLCTKTRPSRRAWNYGFKSCFGIWGFGVSDSYRMAGILSASTGRAFPGQKTGRSVA